MKIIISPAKKMNIDLDTLPVEGLPFFLEEGEVLLAKLRTMSVEQLQALWGCSDRLAKENFAQLEEMKLRENLTPAILAYEGIQYQYMAPGVFTDDALDYIRKNLRILSGFYGILQPFDGVTPYRLEMQGKLSIDGHKNLYAFWGRKIADVLSEEDDVIFNLASKEYSKAVIPYLPENVPCITCKFVEEVDGKLIERGTACKMARGEMVRLLAIHHISDWEDAKKLSPLGYQYDQECSQKRELVFIKGGVKNATDRRKGT